MTASGRKADAQIIPPVVVVSDGAAKTATKFNRLAERMRRLGVELMTARFGGYKRFGEPVPSSLQGGCDVIQSVCSANGGSADGIRIRGRLFELIW
jgi:hypothetical protein